MQFDLADFNQRRIPFGQRSNIEWAELEQTLGRLPLHLKASDQARYQGNPIFDPIGTNSYLKESLTASGWLPNVAIPSQFRFLGTDVDFVKNGIVVEAQFSNYPFLLNNVLRSELFYKSEATFGGTPVKAVIIITKKHMFPASQSTLYYEQAFSQLSELERYNVFDVPIRLVGLKEPIGDNILARWTEYTSRRYSRTVQNFTDLYCSIHPPRTYNGKCIIHS